MELSGIEDYLNQHPLGINRRMANGGRTLKDENGNAIGWSSGSRNVHNPWHIHGYTDYHDVRTPGDVKNDLLVGHKILGTDMGELKGMNAAKQYAAHVKAEFAGMTVNEPEYSARRRATQFVDQPLPGMEDMKAPIDPDSPKPDLHPGSQAAIIAPSDALPKILESGKFKNSFEVGGGVQDKYSSSSLYDENGDNRYVKVRKDAEHRLFGIPVDENDPNARPIYGVVRDKRLPGIALANDNSQYGDAVVDLKDPTKTGKTVTITKGDSVTQADKVADLTKDTTDPDNLTDKGSYTEMQWHDHPGVGDIERVHLLGPPKSNNGMIGQQFLRAGIPVTHHWSHWEFQPSLFEDMEIHDTEAEHDLTIGKTRKFTASKNATEADYRD